MPVNQNQGKRVAIVDYGVGNLFNVERALRHVGAEPYFVSSAREILEAPLLVLPGVGAFGDGIKGLHEFGLMEALRTYVQSGRSLMGICLGMQLLFESSSEFGHHEGIGLIPGVVSILHPDPAAGPVKLPNIGWHQLDRSAAGPQSWDDTALADMAQLDSVYFVHSFAAVPSKPEMTLAESVYGGRPFCAVVQNANVVGCQFHPERSGPVGLSILRNFVKMG